MIIFQMQRTCGQRMIYLMGINFSRLLTLKYGNTISNYLGTKYAVISVGRVMTCVLGMIVRREREIRQFVKTPFYRVVQQLELEGKQLEGEFPCRAGFRLFPVTGSFTRRTVLKQKKDAQELIRRLLADPPPAKTVVDSIERKKEKKNPPLLYNLAELENDCSENVQDQPG